jgi:hypothetical protein
MKNRILLFCVLLTLALLSLTFVVQASYPIGERDIREIKTPTLSSVFYKPTQERSLESPNEKEESIQPTWTPPPPAPEPISPYPYPITEQEDENPYP